MNSLLKSFTGFLKELRDERTHKELGASKQREGDLRDELGRITRASKAGSDPGLLDPERMLVDPNNRDNAGQ